MKRLISAVLVLLALGAAAFFFVKLRRFLPERSRAAELAPAETIFFAQFPNLRQTALSLPQTDLYHIWREPDVQAFLEKPRQKTPWLREWEERFEVAARAAPGEAFVAITALKGSQFVAGFSFAGSQRYGEELGANLRAKFAPGAVSAIHANWVLLASDARLLEQTKERFDGKEAASLANDPGFQKATAPLGAERDFVAFGKAAALQRYLPGAASVSPNNDEPIAIAMRADGGRLHDIISLPASGTPTELSRQTLALVPDQALLYYVAELGAFPSGLEGLRRLLPGLTAIEKSLATKGLAWGQLPAAVGPAAAVILEWPEEAPLPMVLLAAEVSDGGKARAFLEALTDPAAFAVPWSTENHGEITLSIAPPQTFSMLRPALALTDRFALLGLSTDAVVAALPRAKSEAKPPENSALAVAVQGVPPQATAFAWLDFRAFFDRIYRLARPIITLSLAFSPGAGADIDAGKLPPVESITRHLGPTVLSVTREQDRTVITSSGSVTLPGLAMALSAAAMGSNLSELSGILPGVPKPALPAPPPARTP